MSAEDRSRPARAEPGDLVATGLCLSYGCTRAVDGVSFALRPGITALLGPNGSGKTSLIKMLATVTPPGGGTVSYQGDQLRGRDRTRFRSALGYLPQQPSWHGWMTTLDLLRYFAWARGVPRRAVEQRAIATLERVGLTDRAAVPLGQLSGGQFQRAMLGTALVHEPTVLILDEPSVGLDPEQRYELRSILRETAADAVTLISTHILDDISPIADHLLVMSLGKIRHDGPFADFVNSAPAVTNSHTSPLEAAYLDLVRRTDA